MNLSNDEKDMLHQIKDSKRFPMVRFELHSSKNKELSSIALNNVWITDAQDSMETVKARAAVLQSLQEKKLIRINFSINVWVASDFKIYYESKLYETLCNMLLESEHKPNFLFDTPFMRHGLVTITKMGGIADL